MKKIGNLFFFFIFTSQLFAQKISIEEYINMYKDIAMKEMVRSGVPASITLAQGILETENGNSALVKKSNNHFGIKCKETWTGPSVSHDDDAPQECFRKYENAIASYIDHSDFLRTRKHYHFLFDLDPLDYKAWAYGLKKAGYATNPKYPQILIKYIETYNLHDYSLMAMGKKPAIPSTEKVVPEAMTTIVKPVEKEEVEVVAVIPETKPVSVVTLDKPVKSKVSDSSELVKVKAETIIKETLPVKKDAEVNNTMKEVSAAVAPAYPSGEFKINETKVIYADQGTSLLGIASNYNIPYRYLIDFNDFSGDKDILDKSQLIYLQRKRRVGANAIHIIAEGETLHDIAQKEAIRLEALLELNHLSANQTPAAGEKLFLQSQAAQIPVLADNRLAMNETKPALPEASDTEYEVHVVQPKETLYGISKRYNVSMNDIMQWNGLAGTDLKEGIELIVSKKDYDVYKSSR
jgi:LysM repeat protein